LSNQSTLIDAFGPCIPAAQIALRRYPLRIVQVRLVQSSFCRRNSLDVELISPERAGRLNPFLKPTGVVAAMRIGDDRYFDPAQVAVGYARAAAARGATLLPKTDGLAVNIRAGKVTGVTTAKGTILRSAAVEVKDQLPILQTAQVREFRGGIPTMTADGHHILGPAPGVEGFYFASGCNVASMI